MRGCVKSQKSHIGHLKSCISKYKIMDLYTHYQLVLRLDTPNLIDFYAYMKNNVMAQEVTLQYVPHGIYGVTWHG